MKAKFINRIKILFKYIVEVLCNILNINHIFFKNKPITPNFISREKLLKREARIGFLIGYRAAIDCLKDFEEKGVRPTYNNIRKEFEYTYDKLAKQNSIIQQGE